MEIVFEKEEIIFMSLPYNILCDPQFILLHNPKNSLISSNRSFREREIERDHTPLWSLVNASETTLQFSWLAINREEAT